MGMTDKIMDKLNGRGNSTHYRMDHGMQHGGMIGKVRGTVERMMHSRRR